MGHYKNLSVNKQLYNAILQWDADENPYTPQFQDIYYAQQGGLAETEFVFLSHNQLYKRWLTHDFTTRPFVIAETGFGTGLNFLATWQAFLQQCSDINGILHFISVEQFPLSQVDITRSLAKWTSLTTYRDELLAVYPLAIYGWHRFSFANGRVVLTLGLGDINELLPSLYANTETGLVDAWYLDGFSPAKNPSMWQASLFEQMQRLSRADASFSTFTAAGSVRRGLQAVGFCVNKVAGFAGKREMLCGHAPNPKQPILSAKSTMPAWFRYPLTTDKHHAVIIGAGLAGTATAQALSQRGWHCTLLEAQAEIALGGSGNRQGILYPLLSASWDDLPTQFYLTAYQYARYLLQQLNKQAFVFEACGVLQLAGDVTAQMRFEKIVQTLQLPPAFVQCVSATQARLLAGVELTQAGLFFPQAGWVATATVCQQLLNKARQQVDVQLKLNSYVANLQRTTEGWQVLDAEGQLLAHAPTVIFTNASGFQALPYAQALPLQTVRGQVSYVASTMTSQTLATAVCYDGFITPAWQAQHVVGASYDVNASRAFISAADNQANLAKLRAVLPDVAASVGSLVSARSGVRCSSLDHLPLIGALPDYAQFMQNYADLQQGKRASCYTATVYHQGLYVNLAHGSRGLLSALFGAEIIASLLNHEPLPLSQRVLEALAPQRFWVRQLKRSSSA